MRKFIIFTAFSLSIGLNLGMGIDVIDRAYWRLRARSYIETPLVPVNGDPGTGSQFIYFRQKWPSTRHGICATLVNDAGVPLSDTEHGHVWEVELPDLHPSPEGMSKAPTPSYDFNTGAEARAFAEENCPTQ